MIEVRGLASRSSPRENGQGSGFYLMVTIRAALVSAFGVQIRLPCEDASCAAGSRAPPSSCFCTGECFARFAGSKSQLSGSFSRNSRHARSRFAELETETENRGHDGRAAELRAIYGSFDQTTACAVSVC